MDFVRTAQNPWSQEVFMGVAWDLMWAAIIVGVLFAIGHTVWKMTLAPENKYVDPKAPLPVAPNERVQKYSATSRVFHWIMAASMLTLLVTAFFPVLGIQFPWVTIHWIAGVILIALILFHIVHATFFQDFWSMWVDRIDVSNAVSFMKGMWGKKEGPLLRREGKYAWPNKLFHHGTSVFGIAVMVTGVFMMFRVETPFWTRDPYIFADQTWGWIYVIHGLAAVGFITMVMAHIYFGLMRPEKYWMTRSMVKGWITGEEFAEHHDQDRWKIDERETRPEPTRAPAGYEAAD